MLAQIRRARQEEEGFTLIELLVVIVIIGVLAGIVVFAVGGINNTSRNAACNADLKTAATAVEAFRAQNPGYPGDDVTNALVTAAVVPGFLRDWPDTVNYNIGADGAPDFIGRAGATTDCTGFDLT